MAKNPAFVRLADHMVHGLCVDTDTGWGISGYDVKEFPEDKEQARFVRQKINAGVIEAASQAEFDTAHPESEESDDDADVQRLGQALGIAMKGGGKQEHVIRRRETARSGDIREARRKASARAAGDDDEDDDDDFAADQARREEIANSEEQKEAEKAAKAKKASKSK